MDAAAAVNETDCLKRIVAGTDFSEASKIALNAAVDLALAHGAELTIVHAVDPMVASLEMTSQVVVDDTREALEALAKSIKSQGVKVATQMRLGKSWWAIDEAASETMADLVVLASHGRTGLAKLAIGSTADRVLRSCPSPVLMIPIKSSGAMAATTPSQWKRGVVGIDFSDESLLAAHLAARLLHRSRNERTSLHLFHTVALTIEFRGPDLPIALPEQWEQAESASKTQLESIAADLRSAKCDVQSATYRGYPSDGILHEARSTKADFIALGTHGRGTVNRMLLGSVAERVLYQAECPVLTVRHPKAQAHSTKETSHATGGEFCV